MLKRTLLAGWLLMAVQVYSQDYVTLYDKMVRLYDAGHLEEAADFGLRALQLAEDELGKVSGDYLTISRDLGLIYSELYDYESAYTHYAEAAGLYLKVYRDSLNTTLVALSNAAGLAAYETGNYPVAGQHFTQALEWLQNLNLQNDTLYNQTLRIYVRVSEELPHTTEKLAYLEAFYNLTATEPDEDTYMAAYQAALTARALGQEEKARQYMKIAKKLEELLY